MIGINAQITTGVDRITPVCSIDSFFEALPIIMSAVAVTVSKPKRISPRAHNVRLRFDALIFIELLSSYILTKNRIEARKF